MWGHVDMGKVWLNDDGKRILDEDGKARICADCPCDSCSVCPHATDATYYYELTISGFDASICSGCLFCGAGHRENIVLTATLDGVYSVPWINTFSGTERFELSLGKIGTFTNDNSNTCTGFKTPTDLTANIRVECKPVDFFPTTDHTIDITISVDGDPFDSCGGVQLLFQRTGLSCLSFGQAHTGLTDPNQDCTKVWPAIGPYYFMSGGTVDIEVVS